MCKGHPPHRVLARGSRTAAVLSLVIALLLPAGGWHTSRTGADVRWRPTTAGAEDAFTVPLQAQHAVDTAHFRIHFTDTGVDAATPTYVKEVAQVLEQAWTVEVKELGWPAPLTDDGLGGTGRAGQDLLDVYLVDLDEGPYGYVAADEENACVQCRAVHGFLVLENDFVGYDPNPGEALRSTAAHEFAHLIHMGMAWDAEPWAYEATAVWMERVVFPDADARSLYLIDFATAPELALTEFGEDSGGFDRSYGAYVWNLFLAERFGPDLIRHAWEAAAAADAHMLNGYAAALRAEGTTLDEELVAFIAATTTWEVSGFVPEPIDYPTVTRSGTLRSGDIVEIQVDHTAAHIVDLDVGEQVTVTVRGPRSVAGGVAVTASGGAQAAVALDHTLFDGQAEVTLSGIGEAGRVTLAVINADRALARPKRLGDDRARYLNDDITFVVGIDTDPGAPPKR